MINYFLYSFAVFSCHFINNLVSRSHGEFIREGDFITNDTVLRKLGTKIEPLQEVHTQMVSHTNFQESFWKTSQSTEVI